MSNATAIQQQLDILGCKAKDKITGMTGVVTSVCFDLYGCVQVVINPGLGKDGNTLEQHWYDANRIEVTSRKRVMEPPAFVATTAVAHPNKGPAEKPLPG